jgi:kynureninase
VWLGVRSVRRAVFLAGIAVVAAASLVAAPRASAATCWQRVIDDWRDGRIQGSYTPACLRAALRNLPEDLRVYGSAEEDITRALTHAVNVRTYGVLAATATRARRSAQTPVSTPARKATRSLSGRASSKPTAVAAPASVEDTGGSALAPARTAIAAGGLGIVALALAAAVWRTRRRRARGALR